MWTLSAANLPSKLSKKKPDHGLGHTKDKLLFFKPMGCTINIGLPILQTGGNVPLIYANRGFSSSLHCHLLFLSGSWHGVVRDRLDCAFIDDGVTTLYS